jgi:hypothetical protein
MNDLDHIADVLEKAAALVDAIEEENRELRTERASERDQRTRKEAQAMVDAINRTTGETPDLETVMKIAQTGDEDIKRLFKKLASTEEAESLGYGDDRGQVKVAGEIPEEDQQFLNFLLSGN